jgi:hypothetical protein
VVLRSQLGWLDTPSLPHGRAEAEDRHSNFYDAWVNLATDDVPGRCTRCRFLTASIPDDSAEMPGYSIVHDPSSPSRAVSAWLAEQNRLDAHETAFYSALADLKPLADQESNGYVSLGDLLRELERQKVDLSVVSLLQLAMHEEEHWGRVQLSVRVALDPRPWNGAQPPEV